MKVSKKAGFALFGAAVFLLSLLSYVLLRGPSPFDQLHRYSEVELPAGSKAVLWKSEDDGQAGMFELPRQSVKAFAARYNLKPDPVLTYEYSNRTDRCAKEKRAEFLRLNEDTGALEVQIANRSCESEPPSI